MLTAKQEWKKTLSSVKRKSLVEAAFQVLSQKGAGNLTMDHIASKAGVAKGTVYSYFKNKQELVQAVIEESIAPLVQELTELLSSDSPEDQKLREMTLRHLTYFEKRRRFFQVLIYDRMAAQERMKRYKSGLYQDFLQVASGVLQRGMDRGLFRKADPLKVAAMLIEANIAMINQRLVTDDSRPVEKDAELLTSIFMLGLYSKPAEIRRVS